MKRRNATMVNVTRCEIDGCHGAGSRRVRAILLGHPIHMMICEKCYRSAERKNFNQIEDLRYALCKAVRLLLCIQKCFPEAVSQQDMKEIQKIFKASSIPENTR